MGAYGGWSNKPQLGLGNWCLESSKIYFINLLLDYYILFLAIAYLGAPYIINMFGANWVAGCHSYTARWMQLCGTSSNSELNPRTDKWRSKPSRRAPKKNKCTLAPTREWWHQLNGWWILIDISVPHFNSRIPGKDRWARSQKQCSISCRVWPCGGNTACWEYGH